MRLGELIEGMQWLESISGQADAEVTGVQYDSRRLQAGEAFVALRGEHFDGAAYVNDAVKKGASSIVGEGSLRPEGLPPQTPYIGVTDTRAALAHMASVFYGKPSDRMKVVGITGTNGKTTIAHLVRAALTASDQKVGLIGTINYIVGEDCRPAPFTTPEAPEFQGLLKEMHDAGCLSVVSEVSSHALAQRRVDSTRFQVAVFTNLTGEHMDFHHTMDEYFRCKCRLFLELLDGPAIINIDDPYGRELVHMCQGPVMTYSIEREADLRAENISSSPEGLLFSVLHEGRSHEVKTSLLGRPNVWNVLGAAGASMSMGLGLGEALSSIASAGPVEGRFMKINQGQDFLCMVDYAHTGDALRRLIESAREFTPTDRRVITVFGCGGQRDKSKRPVMGAAAALLSDLCIITSDNPRKENPERIIEDIVRGIARDKDGSNLASNIRIEPDRKKAVYAAIKEARPGDTVLIAGKGHEDYQEAGGVRTEFSDIKVAVEAIRELGKAG